MSTIKKEKLVILDGHTVNPGDLPWDALEELTDLTVYERSQAEDVIARIGDASLLMTNKCRINKAVIDACPQLKYIGEMATGYNNIDIAYAREKNITVTNVPNYSSDAVAQLVFALLLEICHHVGHHAERVRQGRWSSAPDFAFWDYPLIELQGKTLGIWGYGTIGKSVARIAHAFGMRVLAHSRSRQSSSEAQVSFVPLEQMLAEADVISLHVPLHAESRDLVNAEKIALMKDGVILINSSRGPIVKDADLIAALESGKVAWYATDVLSKEPPPADLPLLHAPNTLVTPHIGWAPLEARQRLRDIAIENVKQFLNGTPQNVVNG